MSGSALLSRFETLRASRAGNTPANPKKRVSTGKTNVPRSVETRTEDKNQKSREPSRLATNLDVKVEKSFVAEAPKGEEERKRTSHTGSQRVSSNGRQQDRARVAETMKVSSPKTGTSNFEETIPTPKKATTPVDPHAKLIHTFNEKAALLDFVNEIRKADAKCEGVVEAEQLKAVTESLGIQAAPEEVAGLFEACHPVRTPREGRRVVQIQSLARHLWPQAQRPHIQKAKTLSKEPKHLFGLRAAGLLNDTREAALRDIGEIGPLQHINSNFSSSVLDPLNWKQARLKHGPWLGERPLLRMEARSPTTVYAEDGWERTATKIANATVRLHPLSLHPIVDF